MATVLWTVGASSDLLDIFAFLRKDSEVYASVLTARIFDAVERLGDYPYLGRMVPEYQDETIREVIVGNYRVVYRVRGELIGVIGLVHGRQNLMTRVSDDPCDFGKEQASLPTTWGEDPAPSPALSPFSGGPANGKRPHLLAAGTTSAPPGKLPG